jgi:Glycosyltransferase 61
MSFGTVERYGADVELKAPESLSVSEPCELLVSRAYRGAFGTDGELLEPTLGYWGAGADLPSSVQASLPEPDVVHVCNDEVVWGGAIVHAYGHFLIESVARLWPLLPGGELEGMSVVWTTPRELPYVRAWREAFEVRTVELPVDGTVLFTKMRIPEPAWRLNAWIAPEIRQIHQQARAGLDVPKLPRRKVLWLSRSGLTRDRAAYDEVLLEWLLRDHVTRVGLERMSLGEQIGLIESSDAVAGIVGSAFHNMLMVDEMPECVLLCGSQVRSAYVDQALLLKQDTHFVHSLATVESTPSGRTRFPRKFPCGFRVLIPEALRALSETILPGLLKGGDLAALAKPELLSSGARIPSTEEGLITSIARVLLDPMWMNARMRLGGCFEREGLHQCAVEQYAMVAELSDEYAARARHYAARNLAKLGYSVEASEMAKEALAIDSDSKESAAAAYLMEKDEVQLSPRGC